jgi:hypothetical protein
MCLILEQVAIGLERLVKATAFGVEKPTVVHATQALFGGDAESQVDAAMGASLLEKAQLTRLVPVENEIFAKDAHGLDWVLG